MCGRLADTQRWERYFGFNSDCRQKDFRGIRKDIEFNALNIEFDKVRKGNIKSADRVTQAKCFNIDRVQDCAMGGLVKALGEFNNRLQQRG